MRLSKLIASAIALLLSIQAIAQPTCGFDQVHGRRMKSDPVYKENINDRINLPAIQQQDQFNNLSYPKRLADHL